MVNNRYRSSTQDGRAYREADVGSDHCLCIAVVKMKLNRSTSPKEISTKINPKRLNGVGVKEKFQLELSNRFSSRQCLEA